jgi:hypothetical protein
MMTPLLIFVAAFLALFGWAAVHHVSRARRARYIDQYVFPPGIRARVQRRYPQLSDSQLDLVMRALRDYFQLCREADRRMLAMPSQVVDVAWHEFILFTRNYREFCRKALGRFLHHTPSEAMPDPTTATESIKRSWRLACRRAGIDPLAATAVPLLFAIDRQLGIEDGFHYVLDCTSAPMVGQATARYCASHIGCGGGCSGDGGSDGGDGCSGGGD